MLRADAGSGEAGRAAARRPENAVFERPAVSGGVLGERSRPGERIAGANRERLGVGNGQGHGASWWRTLAGENRQEISPADYWRSIRLSKRRQEWDTSSAPPKEYRRRTARRSARSTDLRTAFRATTRRATWRQWSSARTACCRLHRSLAVALLSPGRCERSSSRTTGHGLRKKSRTESCSRARRFMVSKLTGILRLPRA